MLFGTPPERVWRRSLEKIASQSLPETPSYASRIAKFMVSRFAENTPRLPWDFIFTPIGVRLSVLSEHFWLTFGHLFQGLILGLILSYFW